MNLAGARRAPRCSPGIELYGLVESAGLLAAVSGPESNVCDGGVVWCSRFRAKNMASVTSGMTSHGQIAGRRSAGPAGTIDSDEAATTAGKAYLRPHGAAIGAAAPLPLRRQHRAPGQRSPRRSLSATAVPTLPLQQMPDPGAESRGRQFEIPD